MGDEYLLERPGVVPLKRFEGLFNDQAAAGQDADLIHDAGDFRDVAA